MRKLPLRYTIAYFIFDLINSGAYSLLIVTASFGIFFEEKYGEKYKNIIEVHHIIPLSEIKQSYKVNPIKDLLPVCPNCHVVLHSNVGESIEELKERLMEE